MGEPICVTRTVFPAGFFAFGAAFLAGAVFLAGAAAFFSALGAASFFAAGFDAAFAGGPSTFLGRGTRFSAFRRPARFC